MEFETKKSSAPLTALLAAGLALFIYYLSATTLPLLQFFLYFPFTTLLLTEHPKWSVLSFAITTLGMGILFGLDPVLVVMPRVILFSVIVANLLRNKRSRFAEWVISAMCFVILTGAYLLLLGSGTDVLAGFQEIIQSNVDAVLETMRGQGMDGAMLTRMEPLLQRTAEMIVQNLPAIFFLEGLLSAMVTTGMSRWIIVRSLGGENRIAFGSFSDYRVSRRISWVLITLGLLGMVADRMLNDPFPFGSNLLIAAIALYLLNGYARINERMEHQGVRRWVRGFLAVLSFFFAFFAFFGTLMGFFWSFFEPRSARKGDSHEP